MKFAYNTFVFCGFVDVVFMQTFCDMTPQTTRLHRVLLIYWADAFLVNWQLRCVNCRGQTLFDKSQSAD